MSSAKATNMSDDGPDSIRYVRPVPANRPLPFTVAKQLVSTRTGFQWARTTQRVFTDAIMLFVVMLYCGRKSRWRSVRLFALVQLQQSHPVST
jgi:hypothetical protein